MVLNYIYSTFAYHTLEVFPDLNPIVSVDEIINIKGHRPLKIAFGRVRELLPVCCDFQVSFCCSVRICFLQKLQKVKAEELVYTALGVLCLQVTQHKGPQRTRQHSIEKRLAFFLSASCKSALTHRE